MTDYQKMYEQKNAQFDELNNQFVSWQDQTTEMIQLLEKQNREFKEKYDATKQQLQNIKNKKHLQTNSLQKQLQMMKRERNEFKIKFQDFQRKVIELQNINEALQSQNRASNSLMNEYQQKLQKTMQQIALLQTQLQQRKCTSQEQVARLKSQLQDSKGELYVLNLKYQHNNNESGIRKSRLSSSFSSQDQDIKKSQEHENGPKVMPLQPLGSSINIDFKKNKDFSFQKTISLVTNLITELDVKTTKVKSKKRMV